MRMAEMFSFLKMDKGVRFISTGHGAERISTTNMPKEKTSLLGVNWYVLRTTGTACETGTLLSSCDLLTCTRGKTAERYSLLEQTWRCSSAKNLICCLNK